MLLGVVLYVCVAEVSYVLELDEERDDPVLVDGVSDVWVGLFSVAEDDAEGTVVVSDDDDDDEP